VLFLKSSTGISKLPTRTPTKIPHDSNFTGLKLIHDGCFLAKKHGEMVRMTKPAKVLPGGKGVFAALSVGTLLVLLGVLFPSRKVVITVATAALSSFGVEPDGRMVQNQSSTTTALKFQVATWNVWFGPTGNGDPHAGPRMRKLCRLLQHEQESHNPLWGIGLQEVIAETAQYLAPILEKAGYTLFRQPLAAGAWYGCALAVHTSLEVLEQGWYPYTTTSQSRGFLYARVALPFSSEQILFTSTHLESWTGRRYTGVSQRQQQLRELQDFCAQKFASHSNLRTAILTGDMNWDDEPSENGTPGLDPVMSTVLVDGWKDSWLETKHMASSKTCFTYDKKMNPMLDGDLQRRFDRILVHVRGGGGTMAVSTKLLGTQALPDLHWSKDSDSGKQLPTTPSDHFGYVATFQMAHPPTVA
jgi:endonuclease/exonuclease/phosphatase family metal-dependent hydrolase